MSVFQTSLLQCIAWYGASALASTIGRLTLAELKQFPYAAPRYFTVSVGNNVVLDCPAPVSYPPAVIQYFFNNVPLPGQFANNIVSVNNFFNAPYISVNTNFKMNFIFTVSFDFGYFLSPEIF